MPCGCSTLPSLWEGQVTPVLSWVHTGFRGSGATPVLNLEQMLAFPSFLPHGQLLGPEDEITFTSFSLQHPSQHFLWHPFQSVAACLQCQC